MRQKIERTNDYKQAGELYRSFADRERDNLIQNLVDNLKGAALHIQERQVWHFTQADADYGRRVAEGLGIAPSGNGAASNGHASAPVNAATPALGAGD